MRYIYIYTRYLKLGNDNEQSKFANEFNDLDEGP